MDEVVRPSMQTSQSAALQTTESAARVRKRTSISAIVTSVSPREELRISSVGVAEPDAVKMADEIKGKSGLQLFDLD